MMPKNAFFTPTRKLVLFMALSLVGVCFASGMVALRLPGRLKKAMKPQTPKTRVKKTEPLPVIKKFSGLVAKGDVIISLLTRNGILEDTARRLVEAVQPVYNLAKLRAGHAYTLETKDGHLTKFVYWVQSDTLLEVSPGEGVDFQAKINALPYKTKRQFVRGKIEGSLFETLQKAGEKPELADILADLYAYDIDFNRDIQPEDEFAVLVEKKYLKGEFVKYGAVLAASFKNSGKEYRILRFTDPSGKTAYYQPDGKAVRKMFLRCPLPFMRVTSSFGMRRHPVLGFSAKHNGVDFGAPTGTPIRAVGNGTVQQVGRDGGRGNFVVIRHPNGYFSHYYHMSRFKAGIRSGSRVDQKEIIGFVGSTGRSTGPHLHYGLSVGKKGFLNPLSIKSPTETPLSRSYMSLFKKSLLQTFALFQTVPVQTRRPLLPRNPLEMRHRIRTPIRFSPLNF